VQLGPGGMVFIGRRLDVTGNLTITVDDGPAVTIGDDCLFAANVQIRAYDNHSVFDMRTRLRTNYSKPIRIGDGVWMGYDSVAMGGAVIGSGSIVGLRTVVRAATPIQPHCLAVGQPARIAK
jgi:acetyltransferase-like isoleucine patch superfamily enzyme